MVASLFSAQNGAVGNVFALVFILIVLRTLLRKAWLATTVWTVLVAGLLWTSLGGNLTFAGAQDFVTEIRLTPAINNQSLRQYREYPECDCNHQEYRRARDVLGPLTQAHDVKQCLDERQQ